MHARLFETAKFNWAAYNCAKLKFKGRNFDSSCEVKNKDVLRRCIKSSNDQVGFHMHSCLLGSLLHVKLGADFMVQRSLKVFRLVAMYEVLVYPPKLNQLTTGMAAGHYTHKWIFGQKCRTSQFPSMTQFIRKDG